MSSDKNVRRRVITPTTDGSSTVDPLLRKGLFQLDADEVSHEGSQSS